MLSSIRRGSSTSCTARPRGITTVLAAALLCLPFAAGADPPTVPTAVPTIPPTAAPAPSTSVQVVPQRDWSDAIIYMVLVDRFADGDRSNNQDVELGGKGTFHGGDLVGLRQQLDEIASLGATAIWITPQVRNIPAFVTGAGFPDWAYHGYWADDFTTLDPRFGAPEQLQALVEGCHRRGIAVLLDVVYNHAGYNSRMTTDPATRGWFRTEDCGTCGTDDVTMCVAGLPDFKTELPEVADFLLKAQIGWAKASGVDGFRLDTVKNVGHEFWREQRRRTRAELGKSFFLLGEVWGGDAQGLQEYFSDDELDAGFDFSFHGSVVAFLQGRGRPVAFDHYLKGRQRVRPPHLLSQFLSSLDVTGTLYELNGDTELFRLAAILEFTSIGIPVIVYGEEVGRLGGPWPANRSDMPWGDRNVMPGAGQPRDEALRADYQRLLAIRRAHPALQRGVHSFISGEGDVLVYSQQDESSADLVVVALNRGATSQEVSFAWPASNVSSVRDVWGGGTVPVAGDMVKTTIKGKGARILVAGAAH